jgi:hypothetical protein
MKNITIALGALLGAIGLVGVVILILGFPAMWLWNWLMPEIFGLKTITFWQAIGLQILAYIIFPTQKSSSSKSSK